MPTVFLADNDNTRGTRPFDFSDAFYLQNGINPANILNRVNGTCPANDMPSCSVVDNSNTDRDRRNIRVLSTTGGFDHEGNPVYYDTGLAGAIQLLAADRQLLQRFSPAQPAAMTMEVGQTHKLRAESLSSKNAVVLTGRDHGNEKQLVKKLLLAPHVVGERNLAGRISPKPLEISRVAKGFLWGIKM